MKTKQKTNPPRWWGETDGTDPDADKWRVDCPIKYKMALYYLFDEMGSAYFDGKSNESLKDRAIIEALEVIANPQSAGTDEESLAEMAAGLAEDTARYRRECDKLLHDLDGACFLKAVFSDKTFVGEVEARDRRYFLRRPNMAGMLRRLMAGEKADIPAVTEFLKAQTLDDEELKDPSINPALIRADWLNREFAEFADSYLSPWLDYVELPQTFATEKLRAEIAYNFGLFPLPFEYGLDREGNGTVMVSECLTTLLRLLKIAAAKMGGSGKVDGIAQVAFAKLCGVSVKTVQNWDKEKTSPRGLRYTPRFYEKDATAALVWAAKFRQAQAKTLGGYSGLVDDWGEAVRQYRIDHEAGGI